MKKRLSLLLAALGASLLLAACGGPGDVSSTPPPASSEEPSVSVIAPVDPEPEPEPEPEHEPEPLPYVNPLTGEGCAQDIGAKRPVAIMLNNLKKALPQMGVSQADIIYEIVAEGGITRMLGVFQTVEGVGELGSVRSARDYYVSLALGHDALFFHAGGSPQAYEAIKDWGVTALDCVNGPYEGTLYWRDKDRRQNMGYEHSVLTSGETIQELLPTYSRIRQDHKEGYTHPYVFLGEGERASGVPAGTITIRFSEYKTGQFDYDPDTGLYLVSEYGKPYVDGNTKEQVAVKNVFILRTDIHTIKGDEAGRQSVKTTGTGKGQLFCDGMVQDITWSKEKHSSPMTYFDASGQPLKLGVGTSYVNVIGSRSEVSFGS